MRIFRRHETPSLSHAMVTLLAILLVLLIIIVLLGGALLLLRHRRKTRQALELPLYNDKRISTTSTHSTISNHRRVAVRPSQSIHIYSEKQVIEEALEPESPTSSLPEIRITFPEEVDANGKRQSGRVVVVHVGDTGLGLEPVGDKLPAYQINEGGRFDSVDLDRVGGLQEKETRPQPLGWD